MEYKLINIQKEDHFEICTLDSRKSNAISMQMILELTHYFQNFQADSGGTILTGKGNIFSVGLDMKEIIEMPEEKFPEFFNAFLNLVHTMMSFEYPLVIAINGHCPAGGCVLSLCGDYRVMADSDNFRIGLNELEVGLAVPPSIFHLYSFWVGKHNAYQNLLEGKMLAPEEAYAQGLVDRIIHQEQLMFMAKVKMRTYLSKDMETWKAIKKNLRLDLIQKMSEDETIDHIRTIDHFKNNNGKAVLLKKLQELANRKS